MKKRRISVLMGAAVLTSLGARTALAQFELDQGSGAALETASSRWAIRCGQDRPDGGGELEIVETHSGHFVVATTTQSFGAGQGDFWLLKLTPQGRTVWERTYGGTSTEDTPALRETRDGGFVVAGRSYSFGAGDSDFWVLRLRRSGKIRWQRAYGGPGMDWGYAVDKTHDGGFVVAGRTNSFGAGGSDVWILRLSSAGAIEWQKSFGGSGEDFALSIRGTEDQGFVVAGSTDSFGRWVRDFWILKLDAFGQIEWQRAYGGSASEWATAIAPTRDGGYIVAGVTHEFGDYGVSWILKLDAAGDVRWQRAYGGHFLDMAWDALQTADDGFLVGGMTESFGRLLEGFLLKLNSAGKVKWHRTYGDWFDEAIFSVAQTSDGGFVAAGETNSHSREEGDYQSGKGETDLFLLKLSRAGQFGAPMEVLGGADTVVRRTSYAPSATNATVTVTDVTPRRTSARTRKTRAGAHVFFMGSQVLPAAPVNLTARVVSSSQVRLDWEDSSGIEKGFRVERAQEGEGSWVEIKTVKRNKEGCVDQGLDPGALYWYRVRAFNRDGFSAYSNVAQVQAGQQ